MIDETAKDMLDTIGRYGTVIHKYQHEIVPKLNERIEQLQAEIERLKASHESKDDCIYYIRNEAGYCKSEKRNSVYCTGVDCGFCKCIEEE